MDLHIYMLALKPATEKYAVQELQGNCHDEGRLWHENDVSTLREAQSSDTTFSRTHVICLHLWASLFHGMVGKQELDR